MTSLDDTLRSLARRILALDEEELIRLIPKYRKRMDNFSPTMDWEESVIIYFIINGYRVKSAQFSEELKGYMNRRPKDGDWSRPTKPDIRQVLARLTEDLQPAKTAQPAQPARAGQGAPSAEPPVNDSAENPPRPTLRLVRPQKDN
jgi:hypothetical protein